MANYQTFPGVAAGTLTALKWVAFFGATMVSVGSCPRISHTFADSFIFVVQAVYPAFFSLYVAKERRSAVQAMQLSNGLSNPVGLWLGHLLFDSMFAVLAATLIIIIFAAASNQFHGLGFFVSSQSRWQAAIHARFTDYTRCIVGRPRAIWHRRGAVLLLRVLGGHIPVGRVRHFSRISSDHVHSTYDE